MKRQETILHLLILSTIIIITLIANGCCTGFCNAPLGNPLKWGAFGEPDECKLTCEFDAPIFENTEEYDAKIGIASFGSYDNTTDANYCNQVFFYHINNQFLPYPDPSNLLYDLPNGDWFDETGTSGTTRFVDIKNFFWRAGLLEDVYEMASDELQDIEESPFDNFNGFKYNYMEVDYEASAEPTTNNGMVELTYEFNSEFPCDTEQLEIKADCGVSGRQSSIRCGSEHRTVDDERCQTLDHAEGDCLNEDMLNYLQELFKEICVGARVFGLREAIVEQGLGDMIDDECNVNLDYLD